MDELEILYAALHSKHGVIVRTNSPASTTVNLNKARKDIPELKQGLAICKSPDDPAGEVWIVKRKSDGEATESNA